MINPKINALMAATVRRLDKAQPMSLTKLLSEVDELKPSTVTLAIKNNYIENVAEQGLPARYAATNPGRERFGIPIKGIQRTPGRLFVSKDSYDGAELLPFTGRQGSQDAMALKSFGFGT